MIISTAGIELRGGRFFYEPFFTVRVTFAKKKTKHLRS